MPHASVTTNVTTLQHGTSAMPADSGRFALGFHHDGTNATAAVPFGANAAELEAILEASPDVFGDVTVRRELIRTPGRLDCQWTITFDELADAPTLEVDVGTLPASTSGGAVGVSAKTLVPGGAPAGGALLTGSFTLDYNGNVTDSLDAATASARDVEKALEALGQIDAGAVTVSREARVNDGSRFLVTFVDWERGLRGGGGYSWPLLSATYSAAATAGAVDVTRVQSAAVPMVQTVTVRAARELAGAFSLTYGGKSTVPLRYDATIDEVRVAL